MNELLLDLINKRSHFNKIFVGAAAGKPEPLSAYEVWEKTLQEAGPTYNNPDRDTILHHMREIIPPHVSQNRALAWGGEPINGYDLLTLTVSFTDDHEAYIPSIFFPPQHIMDYIHDVKKSASKSGLALTIPEQFRISMDLTDGQIFSATLLSHVASRAVGRNRDTRMGEFLNFTHEERVSWAQSVATFSENPEPDQLGDTYHFWATCNMGVFSKLIENESPIEAALYRGMMHYGSQVMNFTRKNIVKRPLKFTHVEIDRMGLDVGNKLLQ